jgi:hypothetical protein
MNNLNIREKKKPFKSYDLKGFNSICISTGGERGICNSFGKPLFIRVGCKIF